MGVVLDASVTLSWLIPDEETGQSVILLNKSYAEQVFVPSIWAYEVANGLMFAQKGGRLNNDGIKQASELLSTINVIHATEEPLQIISNLTSIAFLHGLTVYDSAYLHLALKKNIPLMSFDKKLIAAAKKAGVRVWEG